MMLVGEWGVEGIPVSVVEGDLFAGLKQVFLTMDWCFSLATGSTATDLCLHSVQIERGKGQKRHVV